MKKSADIKNSFLSNLTNHARDKEGYDNRAVLRYDLDDGFYVRFADGRWMMSKDKNVGGVNKLYYVPADYKEELSIENLEKLDEIATRNIQSGGKLVSIISKNSKKEIKVIGVVKNIEKILPGGIDITDYLNELNFQLSS